MYRSYGLKKSGGIVQLASISHFWFLARIVVSDCSITTNYKKFSVSHDWMAQLINEWSPYTKVQVWTKVRDIGETTNECTNKWSTKSMSPSLSPKKSRNKWVKKFSVVYNKHLVSSCVCRFIGMSLIQVVGPAGSGSEVQHEGTVTTWRKLFSRQSQRYKRISRIYKVSKGLGLGLAHCHSCSHLIDQRKSQGQVQRQGLGKGSQSAEAKINLLFQSLIGWDVDIAWMKSWSQ